MNQFDPVSLEIMWSRMLNIAEEMWTTVLRTAVSTIIASANDFGCEILDAQGRSIAHAYRSMPVFNMTMPNVTKAVLKKHPAQEIRPGDVFLTNDPWLCAGHLPDIGILTPIFYQGRFVGFAGNIANTSDIGGSLDPKTVRDSYEEGIFFPICKLYDQGQPNELVFDMFRWNVRAPEMVLTDIEAQMAANEEGARRVVDFLDEYKLEDLAALSDAIRGRSEAAMRKGIQELPDGVYTNEVQTDGMGKPLKIALKISVDGDEMVVDYTGSSPQVDSGGLNCTLIYTTGHTLYTLACMLTPEVPVNEGCYAPIKVVAPEGSLMNCTFPASVGSRTNTGWYIHGAIFGAFADVVPDRIQSGNGLMTGLHTYGVENSGRVFNAHLFCGGGRGATGAGDGMGLNMFPSSASNVPVEVFEVNSPSIVVAKEFITDSAGAGMYRGAPGQRVVLSKLPSYSRPLNVYFHPNQRVSFPPIGIFGGQDGTRTRIILSGQVLSDRPEAIERGQIGIESPDDRLTLEWSSGAGAYDPKKRDRDLVLRDVRDGLVSPEQAREKYGVDIEINPSP
ncbi:MAG: hydantoinase B/oxoprolinase family protein [Dehalococcoidia bacterium]